MDHRCQYSAKDGYPNPWHLMHLGAFELHGAGTIIVEATAVVPEGRITQADLGLWSDAQIPAYQSLVASLKMAAPALRVGIQLAHAGRKASTWTPFDRGVKQNLHYATKEEGGWPHEIVGPSALPHAPDWLTPREMTETDIQNTIKAFGDAAKRADAAGFDFVEVHGAHGTFSFLGVKK